MLGADLYPNCHAQTSVEMAKQESTMNKDQKKRNHRPSSLHDKKMSDLSEGPGERTEAKRPDQCEPIKLVDLLVLHGF